MMDLTHHQNQCTIHQTHNNPPSGTICIGVDEVGRGSLFGHVSIGAVIMPDELTGYFDEIDLSDGLFALLNDSKKLTAKRREKLYDAILSDCHSAVLVDVPVSVIDTINIRQATLFGMGLAISTLLTHHQPSMTDTKIFVDGDASPILLAPFAQFDVRTLIKGDAIHSSVACASILAKVHRDRQMEHYARQYPDYGLHSHKGYGTAKHKEAILTHGVLPEHRRSFEPIRSLVQQNPSASIQP